jgi:signal transduction histidine kinase
MNYTLSPLAGHSSGYVPAGAPLPADVPPAILVDLNEVMQYELAVRREKIQALQAIIRFDALPQINGSRLLIAQVFHHILNSIIEHPPAGTKLFIYIRCEKEASEIIDLALAEGFQRYEMCVFTNINANESWQQQHQAILTDIRQSIESIQGTFESFAINKTGCLYKMMLPAKFL